MDERIEGRVASGAVYTVEHWRDGRLIDSEQVHNLVPTEGLNYLIGVALKGAAQLSSWFVGIFEGNYTPDANTAAANIVAGATECTAYTSATRPAWTGGSVSGGAVSNSASKAEFTFNAAKTVYGCFLVSASTKGAGTGTLFSAVRFGTAKTFASGDIMRITAGVTAVSA